MTKQEYSIVVDIYNSFDSKEFDEYNDMYPKPDVSILAQTSQNFKVVRMQVHMLHAAFYYSAPNVRWNVVLLTTALDFGGFAGHCSAFNF